MPNDAKLGLLAGVIGVLASAVLFAPKEPPGAATAAKGGAPEAVAVASTGPTGPAAPPNPAAPPASPPARVEAAATPVSGKREVPGQATSRPAGKE